MKFSEAIATEVVFGRYNGRTIGDIAKHEPGGVQWLIDIYHKQNAYGDVRLAIRRFLAATQTQAWLRQKLGAGFKRKRYLLAERPGRCNICGEDLVVEELKEVKCHHGVIIAVDYRAMCDERCTNGDIRMPRMRCGPCHEYPLFSRIEGN